MTSDPALELPELSFPLGLPGFGHLRRFALVHWGPPDSPYARLVSLDDPEVAFLVAPPEAFFDDYDVPLGDEDAALLRLEDATDALVLVLITVGERVEEATANLLGPLVVNTRERLGVQVVLNDRERSTRVPLRAA
jgi:flagellar assembly factor FliW